MNKLTKEQFEFCNTHLKMIEQIVITSACSNISPDYLEGLKEINKTYKYTQCVTCNSSIFLATNSLYKDFIFTKEQIKNEEKTPVKMALEVQNKLTETLKVESNINTNQEEKSAPKRKRKTTKK